MTNIGDIKEYLVSKKRNFVSDVRLRPSDETIMIYLNQDKVGTKANSEVTSILQLNNLKKDLVKQFSKNVEIIFVQNDRQQELESGFYQMLNRKFHDQIVSLYVSFKNESMVDAFIEASNLTSQLESDVSKHFKKILEDADLKIGIIYWLSSPSDLPSLPAILRALKILQPINLQTMAAHMQESYKSVSDRWLRNKLDQLRKKGLVIWQKDSETYTITNMALRFVPAGTKRNSSDIERALALGKRKW
ncbi:hypothetical protein [Methylovulum psychrotolerans]|uniref:Uncharacterized protein n=1 Tax=Methylovulum psychrotolerans TaxID=1704499 RepID=A0A2S5CI61_9GAMM|nr:hypothetical protein [Methylovulum psychrotolerans]POZ50479.1 hypothetical protein AADEFJLK_03674 [Methylovulum psychrotolerans]